VADVANLRGNPAIADRRAGLVAEINGDQQLKEDFLKMLALEETKGVPRTAAAEAFFNRVLMTKGTARHELYNSRFYGPINRGHLRDPISKSSRATSSAAFDAAARGSNLIEGRTDQGARGDPNEFGPGRIKVPGTPGIYNYGQFRRGGHSYSFEDSRRFAEEQNRIAAAARDREKIDKATASSAGVFGGINASVEFLNVPPNVKTNADTDGEIFKQLQISKTRQAGVYRQPFVGYE
jgi:hypothetical protein